MGVSTSPFQRGRGVSSSTTSLNPVQVHLLPTKLFLLSENSLPNHPLSHFPFAFFLHLPGCLSDSVICSSPFRFILLLFPHWFLILLATSFPEWPPSLLCLQWLSKPNISKAKCSTSLPSPAHAPLVFIRWLITSLPNQMPKLETPASFRDSSSLLLLLLPNPTRYHTHVLNKVLSAPQSISPSGTTPTSTLLQVTISLWPQCPL